MIHENSLYTNLKTFFIVSCSFLVLAERLLREPQLAIANSLGNASGGFAIGIMSGAIQNTTERYSQRMAYAIGLIVLAVPTLVISGHEILGYSIFGLGNGGDGVSEVVPLILCVAAGRYATSRRNFSRAGE